MSALNAAPGFFSNLPDPTEDALHSVMARHGADPRAHKVDLGVGVYRDQDGCSKIMRAVAAAEAQLARSEISKAYLPLCGDPQFLSLMTEFVFGDVPAQRIAPIQAPGGTGAIYLALSLVKLANPQASVLVGTPTWPNHMSICHGLGLRVRPFKYFDQSAQRLCFENLMAALQTACAGDAVVLRGPCHNPSGADLAAGQLNDALAVIEQRGLVAVFDIAYCGLARPPEADLAALRECSSRLEECFLALSCSKSFGLYRERTGVLFISAASETTAKRARALAENVARAAYSMPPAHGATVVAQILADETLKRTWLDELDQMRARIRNVRVRLEAAGGGLTALTHVGAQHGIFSLLPINARQVEELAREHAIYMPSSGRINVAGLKTGDETRLAEALGQINRG